MRQKKSNGERMITINISTGAVDRAARMMLDQRSPSLPALGIRDATCLLIFLAIIMCLFFQCWLRKLWREESLKTLRNVISR